MHVCTHDPFTVKHSQGFLTNAHVWPWARPRNTVVGRLSPVPYPTEVPVVLNVPLPTLTLLERSPWLFLCVCQK